MTRIGYLLPRLLRRVALADEPVDPAGAVDRLGRAMATAGRSLDGARVLALGLGVERELAVRGAIPIGPGATVGADVVATWSMLERLADVDGAIAELLAATLPGGIQLHWIDLRDPFGHAAFEMLCYREDVWTTWLDREGRHNRYRADDYARAFRRQFDAVALEVLARDRDVFARARARIQPEFLTGDDERDSITKILVVASEPKAGG